MNSDSVEILGIDIVEELELGRRYRVTYRGGLSLDVVFGKKATTVLTTVGTPTRWHGDTRKLERTLREELTKKHRWDMAVTPDLSTFAWSLDMASSRRADWAFGILAWCETLLPKRLRDEDLGDAMEDLARFTREGRSDWHLLAKAITTALVLLVNAVRETAAASLGKRNAGP